MKLLLGDCLQLMSQLDAASVDAVIADLPYGTTNCPWDDVIPLDQLWQQYLRVVKPHAPIILFANQPFTSKLIMSNIQMFRYCWYWEKEKGTGFLNAKRQPLRAIEEICVFYGKPPVYYPQMIPLEKPYKHTLPIKHSNIHGHGVKSIDQGNKDQREYVLYTHAYPKNVLRFSRDKANKSLVPTQKPLALMEYLVKTYTDENMTVLDNTMGSGTTGLACKNLKRKFIGMENNQKHFQIAQQRLH